jgi:hypothetical protein
MEVGHAKHRVNRVDCRHQRLEKLSCLIKFQDYAVIARPKPQAYCTEVAREFNRNVFGRTGMHLIQRFGQSLNKVTVHRVHHATSGRKGLSTALKITAAPARGRLMRTNTASARVNALKSPWRASKTAPNFRFH